LVSIQDVSKHSRFTTDAIGSLLRLERLDLSENRIRVLPESIGQLSNLKTLYLFYNQITSLPESLGNLKGLQWLGLTGNNNIPKKAIRELKKKLPATRIYTHK
jgi:Leucine-rich repeat (LRR) protein